MAYRLVPVQEPIPVLAGNANEADVRRYMIDENRALREWYRAYQEATNRALNLPSFRVHRNGTDQSGVADTTQTRIAFNSIAGEGWDSHSYFDRVGDYRYTPKIPGVYSIGLVTKYKLVSGTAVEMMASIYLNGASIAQSSAVAAAATISPSIIVSSTVRMNGETDYVDFYTYQGSGAPQALNGAAKETYAYGYKVSDLPT